jgi:hypothetical protein
MCWPRDARGGGKGGAGGFPWGDGGGAWLRLGILVAFGGMWVESVVFSLLLSRG